MIRTVSGIVLLILHLTVCILIWAGIRSGMLKVKKYLMVPVLFVPVWGALCVLILHLQVFIKAENSRKIGIEKLQVNEEIYKNNFKSVEENDHDIVPLEEALLINDPEKRRKLIMDILNDDPSKYIELLEKARMNEDVEVVHYAITAMVELSKDYDSKLQTFERTYAAAPENPVVLDEYCDFMEEYLQQGLLEKQVEHMQRNQYTQLLQKKIKTDMNFHSCLCLADNLMKLKDYSEAQQILDVIDKKWHRREEYWVRKIQLFAEQKNGRAIQAALKQMKEELFYLSSKSKEVLAFWLDS